MLLFLTFDKSLFSSWLLVSLEFGDL